MSKQKQLLKIVNDKCDIFETMAKLKVLNVYMINLFQTLNFRITELLWCLEEEWKRFHTPNRPETAVIVS